MNIFNKNRTFLIKKVVACLDAGKKHWLTKRTIITEDPEEEDPITVKYKDNPVNEDPQERQYLQ